MVLQVVAPDVATLIFVVMRSFHMNVTSTQRACTWIEDSTIVIVLMALPKSVKDEVLMDV